MENQFENNLDQWIDRISSVLVVVSITFSVICIIVSAALSLGYW